MKECIMSFFNAPISNQVPSGVTSVKQLHTYITSNEWLKERTLSVQDALSDEKRFRKLKQNLLPYVTPPIARKTACYSFPESLSSISTISPRRRKPSTGETPCSPIIN